MKSCISSRFLACIVLSQSCAALAQEDAPEKTLPLSEGIVGAREEAGLSAPERTVRRYGILATVFGLPALNLAGAYRARENLMLVASIQRASEFFEGQRWTTFAFTAEWHPWGRGFFWGSTLAYSLGQTWLDGERYPWQAAEAGPQFGYRHEFDNGISLGLALEGRYPFWLAKDKELSAEQATGGVHFEFLELGYFL